MSSIFFPPGLQEAVSGQFAAEQATLGKSFDALLKLRTDEQESARQLFEVLARANPQLAAFVSTNTNIVSELATTPRTLPKKGEKPFGQRVTDAFAQAATAKLPDLFTPEQQRQALNDAREGAAKAVGFMTDPTTGLSPLEFTTSDIEALARMQLTGNVQEAEAIIGAEKMNAYLNTPQGLKHTIVSRILKLIEQAGGLVHPDGTPFSEQEQINFLVALEQKLNADEATVAQVKLEALEATLAQRREEFKRERKLREEGRLLKGLK
jgi:hypothetical protein